MESLLQKPLVVGGVEWKNRVIMAPLTRSRSGFGRIPNALMAEYYRQRAPAGMILTEATSIEPMGVGYPDTPGIWSDEQQAAWKQIVDVVHAEGGKIYLQLWHVGRVSDPHYLNGLQPVAPSAIAQPGTIRRLGSGRKYVVPRALGVEEISNIVRNYRMAADRARQAGFDGVELHGANGYLVDQFLQASSNFRTDQYGGSIDNRSRFLCEVVDALLAVWEPGRVGVHLAPRGEEDPEDPTGDLLFTHVATELGRRKIGFLCCRQPRQPGWLVPRMKAAFGGVMVANQEFSRSSAEETLQAGEADAIAFGRLFISNPDLPVRFRLGATLTEPDPETFYEGGPKGYTDYPSL